MGIARCPASMFMGLLTMAVMLCKPSPGSFPLSATKFEGDARKVHTVRTPTLATLDRSAVVFSGLQYSHMVAADVV